ncbi:Cycloartenol-C-24-methyltransferase [Galdieria sulphuraria]|uniref:Methyltransferase n=1 Tax=Galdieria sulphuraria TaxID=130081 RepID=M2X107_GALSU|nr:sterol 24-C-methyltransferase [Galdieria sulphuraria]EME30045.1 sterol 24-C-methyltransferase [Galdieria sulphuraria]GJD06258.1 Cycloartenol-C-24-methyltransferase [Galdieria sulphuraria]|eukprot:XP_005706565.1 sterol 24-C-methyltransferase [Galdieria sulphuraria]
MSSWSDYIPQVLKFEKKLGEDKKAVTVINEYNKMYSHGSESEQDRALWESEKGKDAVSDFYNLVSDFYEWGWAQSFHFAVIQKGEPFEASLQRYEYMLPYRIGVERGQHLVDLGCGIGGPLRNIARFARCKVTGVTISKYQVERGNELNTQLNLEDSCNIVHGDFLNLPFEDETFDGAYTIEATCHTMEKTKVYSEAYRVIKPGCCFAGYEWCVTDKYDPQNKEHREAKFAVEVGNGLPDTATFDQVVGSLKEAGFEVLEYYDASKYSELPWYYPLKAGFSVKGFRHTRVGHYFTHITVTTLEKLGIVPKGSAEVSRMLIKAAQDLVHAGELGIYIPMFFFLARKPEKPSAQN